MACPETWMPLFPGCPPSLEEGREGLGGTRAYGEALKSRRVTDDLGREVDLPVMQRRIVSLVPSHTETLFTLGAGPRVVGVTRWCEEPAAEVAALPKVGGTKNPDLAAIQALAPDLVIMNAEENRREDFAAL